MYLIEPIRNGKYLPDGALVMAMQVYVLNNIDIDETVIFPYYCEPKVEIGLFQNAETEVNHDYMKEKDIILVRRDTGGGAVYVDNGAVNVCFLMPGDTDVYGNYKKFYQPAVDVLHSLGATEVEQRGRNDLTARGKKVSGAAMTLVRGKIYGGYSLLLDVNYEAMVNALTPNRKKIESKGIKSVRSRVTNIKDHLPNQDMTVQDFVAALKKYMSEKYEMTDFVATKEDEEAILAIQEERNNSWDWVYGKNPDFNIKRNRRLKTGKIEANILVEHGVISSIKFYGDFFGVMDVEDIAKKLVGVKYQKEDIKKVLEQVDINSYFLGATLDEVVDILVD